ncbi:hypothetical protein PH552_12150 [Rhizobium sp. CNPSo 3968]|uniref:hypothetical protein n=1 Tax=Rhizobium sp. CNPSo 3968 TaxID=3021408 RepID=UPI002551A356|nr:hypothetical protein [Rhizobium sp. CNPSo 3968]MDK4720096.1 hypothetical protein [Rhizobium sp. CNPSo 3968]
MKRIIASAFLMYLVASPTYAADSVPWKSVNGWTILVDPSMGNACYMTTAFNNNVLLRFGFSFLGKAPLLYLAVGNRNWQSLEVGKDYPLQIHFDNNPIWSATAFVTDLSGVKFLNVTTSDTNFAQEFSRKLGMTISFQGKFVTGVQLRGSSAAVAEMLNCQTNVNAIAGAKNPAQPPADPFQQQPAPLPAGQNPQNSKDPFSL